MANPCCGEAVDTPMLRWGAVPCPCAGKPENEPPMPGGGEKSPPLPEEDDAGTGENVPAVCREVGLGYPPGGENSRAPLVDPPAPACGGVPGYWE